MNQIDIKSSLYNYSVFFIDNVKQEIDRLNKEEKVTYVIDRNVYNLYKDYFHKIDIDNIYFIDAEEHHKYLEPCLYLLTFWPSLNLKKN